MMTTIMVYKVYADDKVKKKIDNHNDDEGDGWWWQYDRVEYPVCLDHLPQNQTRKYNMQLVKSSSVDFSYTKQKIVICMS